MGQVRNINEVMDQVSGQWAPHVVAELNEYDVKAANIAGDFQQHTHDNTDEFFLVLAGTLYLDLPEGTITLKPMDVYTVPKGVPHRPRALPGTRILMVEPRLTSQDGTSGGNTGTRLDG